MTHPETLPAPFVCDCSASRRCPKMRIATLPPTRPSRRASVPTSWKALGARQGRASCTDRGSSSSGRRSERSRCCVCCGRAEPLPSVPGAFGVWVKPPSSTTCAWPKVARSAVIGVRWHAPRRHRVALGTALGGVTCGALGVGVGQPCSQRAIADAGRRDARRRHRSPQRARRRRAHLARVREEPDRGARARARSARSIPGSRGRFGGRNFGRQVPHLAPHRRGRHGRGVRGGTHGASAPKWRSRFLRGAAAVDGFRDRASAPRSACVQGSIEQPNVVRTLDLDQMPDGSIYVVMGAATRDELGAAL